MTDRGRISRKQGLVSRAFWGRSVLLAFCLLMTAAVSAATFTVSINPPTITLGETAQLSLTFNGANPEKVPEIPAVQNLHIQYIGPSTSVTIIQGEVTSIATHLYTVVPRQPGDYTIPALRIQVGGEVLTSQPATLRVQKPGAPSADAIGSGNQLAFVKLSVPKQQVYVGENFVAEIQVYFNPRLSGRGRPQFNSFPAEGFKTGQATEGQAQQVKVGEATYITVPVSVAIKAIKTGAMTLGPVTGAVVVELPGTNRRRSILDFDPFGRGGEQRQVTLASDELKIEALPLPTENVPPTFKNAIGQYTMTVDAGPTNVATGDPVTIRVQIAGEGSLETLALPEQPQWQNFKVYPPTSKVEPAKNDALGLRGTKTFEQVVVPETPDVKQIPSFVFSYFDPAAKTYRELKSAPIPLTVRTGGSPTIPLVAANRTDAENSPPPAQDIVHIKQRLGRSVTAPTSMAAAPVPLLQRPWFLALQTLPVLAWLLAITWRKRTDELANNPRLRRRRQVEKIVQEGLAELRRHAASRNSDEFFATLFHLLQEQIGERLDLPSSSITDGVVEEHLRPRKVEPSLLAQIQELFQACNQARYAPVRSTEELAAFIPRTETVLEQLRSCIL